VAMKYPLNRVVSAALIAVDNASGEYISAKKAEEDGKESTSSVVKKILRSDGLVSATTKSIDDRLEDATEIINWVRNLGSVPNGTDVNYWTNLKTEFKDEQTSKVGVVGSALQFYNQNLSSVVYKELIKGSKYIGDLRKKGTFFVKLLTKVHKNEGGPGSVPDLTSGYFIYKGITREGALVLFFDSSEHPVEVGDCFLFEGYVKDHKICTFDNVPLTQLNRIKFMENHGQPRQDRTD